MNILSKTTILFVSASTSLIGYTVSAQTPEQTGKDALLLTQNIQMQSLLSSVISISSFIIIMGLLYVIGRHWIRHIWLQYVILFTVPLLVMGISLFFLINPLITNECTSELLTLRCIPENVAEKALNLPIPSQHEQALRTVLTIKEKSNILLAVDYTTIIISNLIVFILFFVFYFYSRRQITN